MSSAPATERNGRAGARRGDAAGAAPQLEEATSGRPEGQSAAPLRRRGALPHLSAAAPPPSGSGAAREMPRRQRTRPMEQVLTRSQLGSLSAALARRCDGLCLEGMGQVFSPRASLPKATAHINPDDLERPSMTGEMDETVAATRAPGSPLWGFSVAEAKQTFDGSTVSRNLEKMRPVLYAARRSGASIDGYMRAPAPADASESDAEAAAERRPLERAPLAAQPRSQPQAWCLEHPALSKVQAAALMPAGTKGHLPPRQPGLQSCQGSVHRGGQGSRWGIGRGRCLVPCGPGATETLENGGSVVVDVMEGSRERVGGVAFAALEAVVPMEASPPQAPAALSASGSELLSQLEAACLEHQRAVRGCVESLFALPPPALDAKPAGQEGHPSTAPAPPAAASAPPCAGALALQPEAFERTSSVDSELARRLSSVDPALARRLSGDSSALGRSSTPVKRSRQQKALRRMPKICSLRVSTAAKKATIFLSGMLWLARPTIEYATGADESPVFMNARAHNLKWDGRRWRCVEYAKCFSDPSKATAFAPKRYQYMAVMFGAKVAMHAAESHAIRTLQTASEAKWDWIVSAMADAICLHMFVG
ncbi:unnamed protein product [Prorocentrum cordatum]|uniref:Uncharacterized protein n=1 Tax=Prorocentrum cordatum TaxID=2364126 RepID=A0ABN9Q8A1_9DINO|nr:unnamed protein product [Polarella glacialis]